MFAELFELIGGPVAGRVGMRADRMALGTARGSFLRGWRLVAIDGFEVDVPDTPGNAEEFGYAGTGENRSAFCKAPALAGPIPGDLEHQRLIWPAPGGRGRRPLAATGCRPDQTLNGGHSGERPGLAPV